MDVEVSSPPSGPKPRTHPPLSTDERAALAMEYTAGTQGYSQRDTLVATEFAGIVTIFSGLVTLAALYPRIQTYTIERVAIEWSWLPALGVVFVGVFGNAALVALTLDLASTHSAKIAIRARLRTIEAILADPSRFGSEARRPQLWSSVLPERSRRGIERLIKPASAPPASGAKGPEREGDLFLFAAHLLVTVWVLIVFALIVFEPTWGIPSKVLTALAVALGFCVPLLVPRLRWRVAG